MSTPIHEKEQFSFPAFEPDHTESHNERRSSDEDGTLQGENVDYIDHHPDNNNHLRVTTSYSDGPDHLGRKRSHSSLNALSPSARREQSRRLDDDLEMLRAERVVSNATATNEDGSVARSRSVLRSRSRGGGAEPVDAFDVNTTPLHEKNKIYKPPAHPATNLAKFFKKVHQSSFLVRWMVYITPLTLVLLIPLLLGLLVFERATVGGVRLFWFGIWLEIVWLTLWLGRIIAKCIPYPTGLIASLFTNNSKKWRDLGKALEIPATLFFWWLAIEISFLPTMKNHHLDGDQTTKSWEKTVNKIIVSAFVGFTLNFVEKIIIQLIAISFHLRTYADRIDINKFQTQSLVKLYQFSKEKIQMKDSDFEVPEQLNGGASGARTPMVYVAKAQKNVGKVMNRVGDVAGKVAGDFTGRAVNSSSHPSQVILQLLHTTSGSQVLARRLYRTFVQEGMDTILDKDLTEAFENEEEAEAAFAMFDKDMNGDISMEELETVCVEIGRERKAITASLKDLDSVVSKLDDVFMFIVIVITILVLISLISTSASGVLTSAGSTVLALSWLFSATAQEFLQSVIFVFVKHPFDVGDRVTIYGNTGSLLKGDDYFVKEIALLYTEFKKMEGHVVQAPNSYLNTLFILNQRRSGGLAEAVPITVKFGTSVEQLEMLRDQLLKFVQAEKREYQGKILTEVTTISENYSITFNIVFFYKSSWQNELLRLQRRNKFIIAVICAMEDLGIQGPRQRLAGYAAENPMFLQSQGPPPYQSHDTLSPGPGPRTGSLAREGSRDGRSRDGSEPGDYHPQTGPQPVSGVNPHPSILRNRGGSTANSRMRGESLSAMNKRVDFSLGMTGMSSSMDFGDVFEDRSPVKIPTMNFTSPSPGRTSKDRKSEDGGESLARTSTRESQKLGKVTSATSGKTHRNRFFSRGRSRLDEEMSLDDLERGHHVGEMHAIPEVSRANSVEWGGQETRARSGTLDDSGHAGRGGIRHEGPAGRLDPRTGLVSPQAVRNDSAAGRGTSPRAGGVGKPPRRAFTGI